MFPNRSRSPLRGAGVKPGASPGQGAIPRSRGRSADSRRALSQQRARQLGWRWLRNVPDCALWHWQCKGVPNMGSWAFSSMAAAVNTNLQQPCLPRPNCYEGILHSRRSGKHTTNQTIPHIAVGYALRHGSACRSMLHKKGPARIGQMPPMPVPHAH